MIIDQEKLNKMQSQNVRIGGKGQWAHFRSEQMQWYQYLIHFWYITESDLQKCIATWLGGLCILYT